MNSWIPLRNTTECNQGASLVGQSRSILCKICGNESGNKTHQAKEIMFGWRESFVYVECGVCGCVALAEAPADLGRFYPADYCSFSYREHGLRGLAKQLRVQAYFGHGNRIGRWIAKRYPRPDLAAMARMAVPKDWRILDVGCGGGKLLLDLNALGYKSLTGTDPFIESDVNYGNGVEVKKCFLTDLAHAVNPVWDLIMFHHSFEHIPDQFETLQAAARLLSSDGRCVIRIPVIGHVWREYGTNWVQLDPPRHFFLHTEKSLALLAQKVGLRVKSTEYDSNEFQFWGSELCRRGVALKTQGVPRRFFSAKQLSNFSTKSDELNRLRQGDQAIFLLSRA